MIEAIQLLRNIGAFDSVNSGVQLHLKKFALIYAENGRGKTTLAAVLRSLDNGDPLPILERKRLGSIHPPHVVVEGNGGGTAVFQNGIWTNRFADIIVYDDYFTTENVCSGVEVETAHRQNLHELIIGAQGVALNTTLQGHIDRIERHNRDLQTKSNTIPVEERGGLSVDRFCALEDRDDIDDAIQDAKRNLAAVREADAVRKKTHFDAISLPTFNLPAIEDVLNCGLPSLEVAAAAQVQAHLTQIGDGSEAWIGDGMQRIEAASSGQDHEVCPFCAQGLNGSLLITHYQAYFSVAYRNLRQSIANEIRQLNTAHSGEIQAAFERAIRVTGQTQQFWAKFTDVPEVALDTAAIALAWKEAFEAVSKALLAKQAAPLEHLQPDAELREKVAAYHALCDQVFVLSQALVTTRSQIDLVKERAAGADVAALESDLNKLKAIKARYNPAIASLCDDYVQEKNRKVATEELRDAARAALDQYRNEIFPAYEEAINTYLQRFNAGFRLDRVNSVNTRTGSSCSYSILINQVPVPLSTGAEGEPSFRNTLSAGDRNALALALHSKQCRYR
jgi:wobble nucleotide-excising tRNase